MPDLRYTLLMLSAVVLCAALLRRTQARLPLRWWQKPGLGIGAFCGAMLGAKLPFALYDWQGLAAGTVWFADGKTIMFGIIGGYLGVEIAKWALDVRVRTGDTWAIPVALAVAIGRLACYVGGCCFGQPTSLPWGVIFPGQGPLPRHPTQLYEFAFHLSAAAFLYLCERRSWFTDQRLKLYILAYLVFRFATEFLRPEPRIWLALTAYQWAALVCLPLFLGLWALTARQMAAEKIANNSASTASSP